MAITSLEIAARRSGNPLSRTSMFFASIAKEHGVNSLLSERSEILRRARSTRGDIPELQPQRIRFPGNLEREFPVDFIINRKKWEDKIYITSARSVRCGRFPMAVQGCANFDNARRNNLSLEKTSWRFS